MHALIVQTGKHKGKKISLPEREVTIGRDENCFIRMTSVEVSREHCVLIPTDRGLLVRDLNSQNGTVVNNVRIESETLLQPGDFLQVGPIQFQLSGSRPTPSTDPGMSDDDIFGWLSESDTATDILKSSDTTIIKATELHPVQTVEPKPKFKTIAEEARDIIRRHKESQENQP
ncbi:MAG TPA: FHA domain-containing protein [Planctomycetaceae bacterium]|nr:FHA domain-containing protein [Planctomycetaceae bacterium]